MKSVNPFFTPAAKKCKYNFQEKAHQTSEKEQFGEQFMERKNVNEAKSTSTAGMKGLCNM